MREFVKNRIKGLYKECKDLKEILENLEGNLQNTQKMFTTSKDIEKLVGVGVEFKKNILKATEGERQFSRYVSSLKELLLLQKQYYKEDVDKVIFEFIENHKYPDIFKVNGGVLVYVDKESENIIENSFLDVSKIKKQIEELVK